MLTACATLSASRVLLLLLVGWPAEVVLTSASTPPKAAAGPSKLPAACPKLLSPPARLAAVPSDAKAAPDASDTE
jgi:hypothetical protein